MRETNLIRRRAAAKLLKVHPLTLKRWEASGRLTPVRHVPGGHVYYDKDQLAQLDHTLQEIK